MTDRIIGCAIEVHRQLGPGLLESIYERALLFELSAQGVPVESQVLVPIIYKGERLGEHRMDIVVDGKVIVELKAVDRIEPVFEAQLLSYLKLTNQRLGLLINFNVPVLKNGIKRVIL
ncbi:MAG: GxxExxY protein [Candidatus Edwardsbacteria bacterium]|nr:GxxExxY protein [Candidatus Edwardsbacteria bacterium]